MYWFFFCSTHHTKCELYMQLWTLHLHSAHYCISSKITCNISHLYTVWNVCHFYSKPCLLRMCFFLHWKVTVVQRQHRLHRRREQGRVLGLTPCDTPCRKRSYTNSCQESELASNGQPMFEFEGPKDTIILIFSNSCLCSDIAIA